jgi:hypothetical protein
MEIDMKQYLLASTLLSCSAILADSPQQEDTRCETTHGNILSESCPAAYNFPGGVTLYDDDGQKKPFDTFVTASFLYYYASEGGLDLANSSMLALNVTDTAYVTVATANSQVLFQDFKYAPGFQVGIGMNFCEWCLLGEYTWIRNTTHTSAGPRTPDPDTGPGVWIMNNWFQQLSPLGQTMSATDISSKWHLAMDIADLTAGRPFYEGRNVMISPFLGIRGAWIRQNVKIGISVPELVLATSGKIYSYNSSHSWGIGPRLGFKGYCLLGKQFRLQGSAGASLLFTEYTHVRHIEDEAQSSAPVPVLRTSLSSKNFLRPQADVGLGLGWGSHFMKNRYYIDFSAEYDFNVFWEQNMIRKLLDQTISGIGAAASNLYLHGLNITARFDF